MIGIECVIVAIGLLIILLYFSVICSIDKIEKKQKEIDELNISGLKFDFEMSMPVIKQNIRFMGMPSITVYAKVVSELEFYRLSKKVTEIQDQLAKFNNKYTIKTKKKVK